MSYRTYQTIHAMVELLVLIAVGAVRIRWREPRMTLDEMRAELGLTDAPDNVLPFRPRRVTR